MQKHLLVFCLCLAALGGVRPAALAQGREKILFIGTPLAVGVGRYNGTGLVTGFDTRFQLPLASNFVLTGKTGLEVFFVKGKYKDYFRYYYDTGTGLSIPVTVGPRFYIIDGLHAGLNLGVDIGVTRLAATSFRFEPMVGYAIPLPNGNYVDVGTSFITSFSRGSGAFSFNFAYGINFGR